MNSITFLVILILAFVLFHVCAYFFFKILYANSKYAVFTKVSNYEVASDTPPDFPVSFYEVKLGSEDYDVTGYGDFGDLKTVKFYDVALNGMRAVEGGDYYFKGGRLYFKFKVRKDDQVCVYRFK